MIGTYNLRDEILLAVPPPHPSEGPPTNPNPLNTTIAPPTAGVKLSFAILAPKHASYQRLHQRPETPDGSSGGGSAASHEGSHPDGTSSAGEGSGFRANELGDVCSAPVVFGSTNPLLASGKDGKKEKGARKPRNNMVKSSSTFISRVIPHEGLKERLAEHSPEGLYAFANVNRAFQWMDLSSTNKVEHLTKILFTKGHALCHDVNQVTKSASHLDVIIGFNTGDIVWYEPLTQKYARLNKNGSISNAAVSDIRWMPGSENLFITACMDGTVVVYDKEKEDAAFVPEELDGAANGYTNGASMSSKLKVLKSVNSRNQKTNPIAAYKLTNQKLNSLAFSPSGNHLAIVSEDGNLRILDLRAEKLIDVYTSYYGGLICVTWSPDGRYILTGGQDDLVSIWSFEERGLVARCQGHSSWVTGVAFDVWRCDDRNYRFGSVGEDSRLLLWDFSVGMLHRPRAASMRQPYSQGLHQRGGSVVSTNQLAKSQENLAHVDSGGNAGEVNGDMTVHAVEPRRKTSVLPPVMAKSVDAHALSWLGFEEDAILTCCREGHIRTWDRPKEGAQSNGAEAPSTTSGSAA